MDLLNNLLPQELYLDILMRLDAKSLWEMWNANEGDNRNIIKQVLEYYINENPALRGERNLGIDDVFSYLIQQEPLRSLEFSSVQASEAPSSLRVILGLGEHDLIVGVTEVDIHPITKRCVVGVTVCVNSVMDPDGRIVDPTTKVVLCECPSWSVIRTIHLNNRCRLLSIRTIRAPAKHRTDSEYMTLLTIGLGTESFAGNHYSILSCFCFHDDSQLLYVGNMQLRDSAVFYIPSTLFYSQALADDSDRSSVERVKEWLPLVCPGIKIEYDHTVFATVFQRRPFIPLFEFDLRKSVSLDDQKLITLDSHNSGASQVKTKQEFHEIGTELFDQYIYFRPFQQLDHLVAGGGNTLNLHLPEAPPSRYKNEVRLYDWRFGKLVGVLPLEGVSKKQLQIREYKLDQEHDASPVVSVWESCKFTPVMPEGSLDGSLIKNSAGIGLHLSMLGSTSNGYKAFATWDVSYMLNVDYNPLAKKKLVAKDGVENKDLFELIKHLSIGPSTASSQCLSNLPYSPPKGSNPLVVHHEFQWREQHEWMCFEILENTVVYSSRSALTFVDSKTGLTLHVCKPKKPLVGRQVQVVGNKDIFILHKDDLVGDTAVFVHDTLQ